MDGRWRYAEPGLRADYPDVLAQVHAVGFETVMLEVLPAELVRRVEWPSALGCGSWLWAAIHRGNGPA